MLNGDVKPTEDEIANIIGKKASLWKELQNYLKNNYDFTSELVFMGRNMDGQYVIEKAVKPYVLCFLRKALSPF